MLIFKTLTVLNPPMFPINMRYSFMEMSLSFQMHTKLIFRGYVFPSCLKGDLAWQNDLHACKGCFSQRHHAFLNGTKCNFHPSVEFWISCDTMVLLFLVSLSSFTSTSLARNGLSLLLELRVLSNKSYLI